jgi:hypothetical protein
MDSVTEENIAKIMKERDSKISELDQLKSMTEKQIWLNELSALRKEYIKMTTEYVNSESVKPKQKGVVVKSKTTAKVNKAK